jgi:hypothetical protein
MPPVKPRPPLYTWITAAIATVGYSLDGRRRRAALAMYALHNIMRVVSRANSELLGPPAAYHARRSDGAAGTFDATERAPLVQGSKLRRKRRPDTCTRVNPPEPPQLASVARSPVAEPQRLAIHPRLLWHVAAASSLDAPCLSPRCLGTRCGPRCVAWAVHLSRGTGQASHQMFDAPALNLDASQLPQRTTPPPVRPPRFNPLPLAAHGKYHDPSLSRAKRQ